MRSVTMAFATITSLGLLAVAVSQTANHATQDVQGSVIEAITANVSRKCSRIGETEKTFSYAKTRYDCDEKSDGKGLIVAIFEGKTKVQIKTTDHIAAYARLGVSFPGNDIIGPKVTRS